MLWASVKTINSLKGWKLAILLVIIMGISTELIQEYAIVTRQGSLMDFLADVAGAAIAMAILNKPMKAMIMDS